MSDIVKEIADHLSQYETLPVTTMDHVLLAHAAAEIERLRAEVERLGSELTDAYTDLNSARQDNGSFTAEFKHLQAEVERLRAALAWIDQQRYTRRDTINPANGYDRAVALNEKLISVMDAAIRALKDAT